MSTEKRIRVAAIDCGTNSIRLLISDIDGDTKTDLVREMQIVRLGQDVDTTGSLAPEAIERTLAATRDYADLVGALGATRIRFCATSAARDASNAGDFSVAVEGILGVRPEVLSGDDEAAASFLGAARDLPSLSDPSLVVDIGGGSTELIVGHGETVDAAQSLNIGSVRMTERHLHSDPPSRDEVADAIADIDVVLDSSQVDLVNVGSFVGVAGTITTVAAHTLGLQCYDSARIHLARLSFDQLGASCEALIHATVAERKAMPFMHPGRADVIGGGALIVQRIMARLAPAVSELVVSEHDILDGIAWSIVDR